MTSGQAGISHALLSLSHSLHTHVPLRDCVSSDGFLFVLITMKSVPSAYKKALMFILQYQSFVVFVSY